MNLTGKDLQESIDLYMEHKHIVEMYRAAGNEPETAGGQLVRTLEEVRESSLKKCREIVVQKITLS